ncbi:MAG: 4-hydroxy-tetrahydrodipicolinate reductase [Acholeplasmataceae bacterium]
MIKVIISGINGKMGQILKDEISLDNDLRLVGGYDKIANDFIKNDFNKLPKTDILIDFSVPSLLDDILNYAVLNKVKLILATTGYTSDDFNKIKIASKKIPIFYSANYSIGINQVINTLTNLGKTITKNEQINIIDIHHKDKIDSPSGTALYLANHLNNNLTEKRDIKTNDYQLDSINIHSIRSGSTVGIHEIIIANNDETITIKHDAHNKNIFAKGAIFATKFIYNKEKGLYYMKDLYEDNNGKI